MNTSSQHTMLLASISVAILLVALGIKLGIINREPSPYTPEIIPAQFDRTVFNEVDTDGDGVEDWQEFLIGTDPENRDTDGDGNLDALPQEVTDGLISTTTNELVDRLLTFYTASKTAGDFTPEAGFDLARDLSEKLDVALDFTPFTSKNIQTKKQDKKVYAANVRTILAPLYAFKEPEFGVYARYVQNGDKTALGDLLLHAEGYQRAAKKLMAMQPPPDIVDDHVELANALSYFAVVLNAMVSYADDPMASLTLAHLQQR